MATYKLIGAKEGETKEQTVIRCANNLLKACAAAGCKMESYPGIACLGIDVTILSNGRMQVASLSDDFFVNGYTPIKVTFVPKQDDLTLDE